MFLILGYLLRRHFGNSRNIARVLCVLKFAAIIGCMPLLEATPSTVGTDFKRNVEPLLSRYCYDCHGDGESKGKVTLDQFKSDDSLTAKPDLWWAVLKNVRAGI